MMQVSGRAGRKDDNGKVIIQTWKPENKILSDILNHDYLSMYNRILNERNKFLYPPFYRLIIVRMKHRNSDLLNKCAASFADDIKQHMGKLVYGPEYPLVGRIRNYYIKNTMIKVPKKAHLKNIKTLIKESVLKTRSLSEFRSVIVQYDIDPQ
jgi:primosomal protein N' (replication factor Y)